MSKSGTIQAFIKDILVCKATVACDILLRVRRIYKSTYLLTYLLEV